MSAPREEGLPNAPVPAQWSRKRPQDRTVLSGGRPASPGLHHKQHLTPTGVLGSLGPRHPLVPQILSEHLHSEPLQEVIPHLEAGLPFSSHLSYPLEWIKGWRNHQDNPNQWGQPPSATGGLEEPNLTYLEQMSPVARWVVTRWLRRDR